MKTMTKLERILATLHHQPVDRCAVLEQLSYSPRVIADWTGKRIDGFNYTVDDICAVIRQTCDLAMPPFAPRGTERVTTPDGFVIQNDNWTGWHVSRPFTDAAGARDWLLSRTAAIRAGAFDPARARADYRHYMLDIQAKIGDTVILNYSWTGFCHPFDSMGLEIFTFFQLDYPEVLKGYMEASIAFELRLVGAGRDVVFLTSSGRSSCCGTSSRIPVRSIGIRSLRRPAPELAVMASGAAAPCLPDGKSLLPGRRSVMSIIVYDRYSSDVQRPESCGDQERKVREYL